MDRVILLTNHLKSFQYIEDSGSYVDGIWTESLQDPVNFKAAPFPINQRDLKLFPQGALSLDDIKLYTKYDLSDVIDKNIKRVSTSEIFRLYQAKPFQEIADLKIYILKKWTGEVEAPTGWILAEGIWNDNGVWIDTEVWIDEV